MVEYKMGRDRSESDTFSDSGGSLGARSSSYCPGCGHGIVQKLLTESIDQLSIRDRTILLSSIGCSFRLYETMGVSAISCAHGRAPAVGTSVSRALSDAIVVSYQGDGDLSSIGMSHIIHSANRGENMAVLFVNNMNFGITGGQYSPTTLLGQNSTTTPFGRSVLNEGIPIRMSELLVGLEAPVLVARTSVSSPIHIRETKRLIQRGLQAQIDKKGFVFIEILSMCPTNWHLQPVESARWLEEEVVKTFPLQTFRDEIDFRPLQKRAVRQSAFSEIIRTLGIKAPLMFDSAVWPPGDRELRVKIAGFRGQGVMSLGRSLADLGIRKGLESTWMPSYGPEMRSGSANCSVVLSRRKIASPIVERPDILVAMNKPSLLRFAPLVDANGFIVYNRSLIDSEPEGICAKMYPVPATELAGESGNVNTANTVCLAVVAKIGHLFTEENLQCYLREVFRKPTLIKQNEEALRAGWQFAF